ncbi:hypothetical protein AYO20_01897 [Fonsecaea nubica]|uniref:Rhodopsin domain-containing protein n=1 Tax=Fonsecaea nubica TaxID=856822 RepID=A0A178DBX4_9EURO|nr:hypothetical protein AYO20_01897 [Fonsecaea nubica]OAL38691.1 hypothetical protein AYO20_01897 [Fonsecaea nubica]
MGGNYVTEVSVRATGITMIILTTFVAGFRIFVSAEQQRRFGWDDGWLLAAYIFFLALSILYIVAAPTMFRLTKLADGQIPLYPTVADDGLFIQKIFFVTTSGLWLCLWCVKFSLMAVYKKLMKALPHKIRLWWAVVIFCVVVLAGAITSSMLSCSSMKAWFTAGACSTPRDVKAASISLWYAYAVDIVTDLMIMLLPLDLIWNLKMPRTQKASIGALFCLGFVCIVVATIRVKELGSTVNNTQPSTTWLALWGIVESSIAVLIGCGPGLYRKARTIYQTRHGSNPSRGYARYANSNSVRVQPQSIALENYQTKKSRTNITSNINDAASSQEELASTNLEPGIGDTKMATESIKERDVDSVRHWDDRPHAY